MHIPEFGILANIPGVEPYAHIDPEYYYLLERGLERIHAAVIGAKVPLVLEDIARTGWTDINQSLQAELARHHASAEGQRTAEIVAVADQAFQEASQPDVSKDQLRPATFLELNNLGRTATTTFLEERLDLGQNTLNDPLARSLRISIGKPANDLGGGVRLQFYRPDLAKTPALSPLAGVHVSGLFAFANLTYYYSQNRGAQGNLVRVPGFLDAVFTDVNEFVTK